MSARDCFKVGDRVRMTVAAIQQGLDSNGRGGSVTTGVVVGFGKEPDLVLVVKDGQVTIHSWSADYWTVQEPAK